MPRIHLFEFEDFAWFPDNLRNYGTDFLQFLANKTQMYKPIIPVLKKGIEQNGRHQIIDLASGGGGGLLWISEQLKAEFPDLKITLTDYFPNLDAFEFTKRQSAVFEYIHTSVDARKVPGHLKGLRTQFLSLHHFRPEDARKILQNAVDSQSAIAVFEAQERSIPSMLPIFFSPLTVFFTTPFIRPFKLGRLFFTYLLPLVPMFIWWDGLVSSLRTYSVKEMEALVKQVRGHDTFDWEIGRVKSGPGAILYLLGTLKRQE
ncbi:hypothetical protein AAG747_27820 [Rapidithrix thailandica]|uniref:Class I SAM-dependent methyltransferase n=1 Tax=Rapidithrix thailandica TaxID=413964 RepID=A0AAW9S9A9_9BACT